MNTNKVHTVFIFNKTLKSSVNFHIDRQAQTDTQTHRQTDMHTNHYHVSALALRPGRVKIGLYDLTIRRLSVFEEEDFMTTLCLLNYLSNLVITR